MRSANTARREFDVILPHGDQRHFLESLRDGVIVHGPDLRLVFYNASYLALYDLADEDMVLGEHLEDTLRALARKGKLGAPEGEPVEETVTRRLASWGSEESKVERRAMETGRVIDIYRTTTIDGDIVSVHVDVTQAVVAEQEIERQRLYMKVLLQNVSDGINLLDRHGRFVMFNDRFPELYGIDPASVSWGIPYAEFTERMADLDGLSPEGRRAEIETRTHFALDPTVTHARRRLSDGRTLNIQKTNLPDGGSVMTMRDMTEELRREDELLKARALAEETARHKADFVARMSHEMRTPLNGILGVAALLAQLQMDQRQREMLDVIGSSGRVLLRLIDDILDLSRLDAKQFEVVADDLDIAALLEQCLSIVEPGAGEKGLAVVLRHPPAPIPLLRGDTVRIKQIVLNLLTNAVKFTERGHVEVALDGTRVSEGVRLSIRVTDTGVGVPADKLDHIFDSFYQIDSTVTRKYGGAGLGLAITSRLVDAMGGSIMVSSELGMGTVFRVHMTLPLAQDTR